jgi:hypothetical protein
MKRDPLKFTNPKFNSWKLEPDTAILFSKGAESAAKEAGILLRRVIEDHPATPWALLAQRELENPFGFKWVEHHVPPRPRNNNNNDAAAKKKKQTPSMTKPQEVPKL